MTKLAYVIYGAGAIGGTVGARLAQAGLPVTLIARGEHARVIGERGLRLRAPGEDVILPLPVVTHPAELEQPQDAELVVVLAMKSQHTEQALQDLQLSGLRDPHVVCMQNGVANERLAARHFEQVYAAVVNLPAMHLTPGEVITHAQGHGGILDTGCYPQGSNDISVQINADLTWAGFSARPDDAVMRQKYAKLLMNLANILQAGIPPSEDTSEVGRSLRREALACFAAAGIECATQEEARARRQGVYRMAEVEGVERTGGSSWQSLARGTGDIETDYLNGEICALGRQHGVPTPVNDACMRMAREILAGDQQPWQFTVADLEGWIEG